MEFLKKDSSSPQEGRENRKIKRMNRKHTQIIALKVSGLYTSVTDRSPEQILKTDPNLGFVEVTYYKYIKQGESKRIEEIVHGNIN